MERYARGTAGPAIVLLICCWGCGGPPPTASEETAPPPAPPAAAKSDDATAEFRLEGRGQRAPITLEPARPDQETTQRDWTVVKPSEREALIPEHPGVLRSIAMSSDGSWVLSADDVGTVCSWGLNAGAVVRERCLDTEIDAQLEVAVLHGGTRFVIAGGRDVQMLGRGGPVVTRFTPRAGQVQVLVAAPNSNHFFYAAGKAAELCENDFVAAGVADWTSAQPATAAAVSDKGSVVWVDRPGRISTRALGASEDERRTWTTEHPSARARRFSGDGRWLASAYEKELVVRTGMPGSVRSLV